MSTEARLAALEEGQEHLKQGQAKLSKDHEKLRSYVEENIDRISRDNVKGCITINGAGVPPRDKASRESAFNIVSKLALQMFNLHILPDQVVTVKRLNRGPRAPIFVRYVTYSKVPDNDIESFICSLCAQ